MKKRAIGLAALLCLLIAPRIAAQDEEHHHHDDGERLGSVTFPTSCSPDVQKSFERAVALMHSFQYQQASEGFDDVAAKDKHCAMARWGQALAIWHQLWDEPDAKKDQRGTKIHSPSAENRREDGSRKAIYRRRGAFLRQRQQARLSHARAELFRRDGPALRAIS